MLTLSGVRLGWPRLLYVLGTVPRRKKRTRRQGAEAGANGNAYHRTPGSPIIYRVRSTPHARPAPQRSRPRERRGPRRCRLSSLARRRTT
eukprot:1168842-Prymnesium_polylepis.1